MRGSKWVVGAVAVTLAVAGCSATSATLASSGSTPATVPPPVTIPSSASAAPSGAARTGVTTPTSAGTSESGPSTSPLGTPSPTPPATSLSAPTTPEQALARLSLPQQVGELLMIGNPGGSMATQISEYLREYHIGSVILTGRSHAGAAAATRLTTQLQSAREAGSARLLIATDQEGGQVQVLQGPGFGRMPSALQQAETTTPGQTRRNAAIWGTQLRQAGVNVDFAPVLDTVTKSFAPSNRPIGYYDREWGYTPDVVSSDGVAFARGLADAGIAATAKHFPGLGRVRANTDTAADVTDTVTTRDDANLAPFRAAVGAGVDLVMISSAVYARIDPSRPALFSPTVITGMLRGDLGFDGVVISDDLAAAVQVEQWRPGARAVNFVAAGGDIVLAAAPAVVPAMFAALLAKAQSNTAFAAQVSAAALRVLRLKESLGLLPTTQ